MSNFKLSLPTDVPWERICVTEDMIDRVVCDDRLPAKWQTSIAVFKYRPDDEYQTFPKYEITYLKVTATITGYQPLDKEIQGTINWHGVNVATLPDFTDLLNSYNPCNGAILQVTVGPPGGEQNLALSEYPFFMDFEPKKREMYELATDTQEKQSRSIESLNITKSAGATQSMEILDVDMGGGGFGMQASYAGTGGGFNYTAPNGQWGTKRLNADESLASRSSDVGQEKRETFSHSTQISQMYHLLDSYHLGTNRAVFFIQPRPHVLEEPSGFVRGPRPVEGIQEFFMVVAKLKEQPDFCVSVRLDTSHLTTLPIMDYDRKSESTSIAQASAPVASDHDIPAEYIVGMQACFGACWDVHYQCYRTDAQDNVTYDAPAGYRIESYNDLINQATHGSTNVVVTPNGATLNINVEATGHNCYEGSDVCVNCPDTIQSWAGSARRQVQVNLVSTEPTKQIGEEQALMITTRGLCCCAQRRERVKMDEYVVAVMPVPSYLSPPKYYSEQYGSNFSTTRLLAASMPTPGAVASEPAAQAGHVCKECAAQGAQLPAPATDAKTNLRRVNELSNYIKQETIKSLNNPTMKLQKFVDTDFFIKQLEYRLLRLKKGRDILYTPALKDVPSEVIAKVARHLKRDPKTMTRRDLLSLRSEDLVKISGIKKEDVTAFKLGLFGVEMQRPKPSAGAKSADAPRKSK